MEKKDRYKTKNFVLFAEYLEMQAIRSRYKRKNSNSRRVSYWWNHLYLTLFLKRMKTMLQSY